MTGGIEEIKAKFTDALRAQTEDKMVKGCMQYLSEIPGTERYVPMRPNAGTIWDVHVIDDHLIAYLSANAQIRDLEIVYRERAYMKVSLHGKCAIEMDMWRKGEPVILEHDPEVLMRTVSEHAKLFDRILIKYVPPEPEGPEEGGPVATQNEDEKASSGRKKGKKEEDR